MSKFSYRLLHNLISIIKLQKNQSVKANFKLTTRATLRILTPSNKTPALRKSTNTGIWVVGTSNQLFIRGS